MGVWVEISPVARTNRTSSTHLEAVFLKHEWWTKDERGKTAQLQSEV
jgi:hypothetical protein